MCPRTLLSPGILLRMALFLSRQRSGGSAQGQHQPLRNGRPLVGFSEGFRPRSEHFPSETSSVLRSPRSSLLGVFSQVHSTPVDYGTT
jgi:hypothetical protein